MSVMDGMAVLGHDWGRWMVDSVAFPFRETCFFRLRVALLGSTLYGSDLLQVQSLPLLSSDDNDNDGLVDGEWFRFFPRQ